MSDRPKTLEELFGDEKFKDLMMWLGGRNEARSFLRHVVDDANYWKSSFPEIVRLKEKITKLRDDLNRATTAIRKEPRLFEYLIYTEEFEQPEFVQSKPAISPDQMTRLLKRYANAADRALEMRYFQKRGGRQDIQKFLFLRLLVETYIEDFDGEVPTYRRKSDFHDVAVCLLAHAGYGHYSNIETSLQRAIQSVT